MTGAGENKSGQTEIISAEDFVLHPVFYLLSVSHPLQRYNFEGIYFRFLLTNKSVIDTIKMYNYSLREVFYARKMSEMRV